MTQEDKDLLLKDLCARLPYGVKVECKWKTPAPNGTYGMICKLDSFLLDQIYNMNDSDVPFDEFKPYLFPLSSMTKEQRREYAKAQSDDGDIVFSCAIKYVETGVNIVSAEYHAIDWLIAHHFDYRGLIEKGLALDATNENIY